jgi:UDP-3-O-[3-hydroxymyristoyl] N-acetylglucosamine deacetylase
VFASLNNIRENQQHTIKKMVSFEGIGVHKAQAVTLKLLPAKANTGIVFKRVDLPGEPYLKVDYKNTEQVPFCSRISNGVASVITLEHLMAALWATAIDNVEIHLSSEEVPILDGSADPFIEAILNVGIKAQKAQRQFIRILKEVHVGNDQRFITLSPSDAFSIDFEIDFLVNKNMSAQRYSFKGEPTTFRNSIAKARTFGFIEDAPKMKAAGIALGASLDNVVVIQDGVPLNEEGFRFEDECVKHKVLDAVGDLYLAGFPIIGAYTAKNAGHEFNAFALKTLLDDADAWCFEQREESTSFYQERPSPMMTASAVLSA